jgi:EAL domain-containing protein (putative c-di-GMP-specific phosphodiesterase class I)
VAGDGDRVGAGGDRAAVAERVEQPEQLGFLALQGCDLVQGFHLGRPVSPEEITALFRDAADAEYR